MRVNKNARGGDCKNGLANTMKLVIALVFTATMALLNMTQQPPSKPLEAHLTEIASAQAQQHEQPKADEQPAEETKPEPEAQEKPNKPAFNADDPSTWPKCAEGEIVRADNGQCAKRAVQNVASSAAPVRAVTPSGTGSGSCAAEIAKYDWNVTVATAVARAESGLNPGVVNNNPATGDYSVGCFQVNLYGANARTRPSEAALKNAATNVQWAYNNYVANGHSFLGQWGVCRSKVSCY